MARREGALWAWRTPTLGTPNTPRYGHPMTQIKRYGCDIHLALRRLIPQAINHHRSPRRFTTAYAGEALAPLQSRATVHPDQSKQ